MLGYSVTVHEVANTISESDFARVHELPYPESIESLRGFVREPGVHVASCIRVDAVLDCVENGRARLVHDGGYPYLIYALGADITAAFSDHLDATVLRNGQWYMVEAWDQS